MALRAGYYGLKTKLLDKVKALPGIKSIGSGLSLNSETGELTATGTALPIEPNPEGAATEDLTKILVGETIYEVNDNTKCYQTDDSTESAIVDADYIPFLDSSAASGAGAPRKSTWANFISKIKAKITEFVTWEANGVLGAKNLLPNKITSQELNGITYSVNSDGTVNVYGTATADSEVIISLDIPKLYNKDLILTGCPSGGSENTYRITAYRIDSADGSSGTLFDIGDGLSFRYKNVSGNAKFLIYVKNGTNMGTQAEPKVFKPMLRFAFDTDPAYQHYAMTNKELTEKTDEYSTRFNKSYSSTVTSIQELAQCIKYSGLGCVKLEDVNDLFGYGVQWVKVIYVSQNSYGSNYDMGAFLIVAPLSGNTAKMFLLSGTSSTSFTLTAMSMA